MNQMTIGDRLSGLLRAAGDPPLDEATFVLGWRSFSEWMDVVWVRCHGAVPVLESAYGYDLELDMDVEPDWVALEVHG